MRTMTHSAMTLVACMALGCPGGDDTTARPPRSTATPPATAAQGTTPSERAPATPAVERAATPSAPVAMALEPAVDLVPVLGSVRVVALYDGEALPSASRQVGRFVSVVGRARDAHLVEPDAAERAAATAWLDAADRPIPAAWSCCVSPRPRPLLRIGR